MFRKRLLQIHLYLAAIFAAPLLMMGFSGGLYLSGQKGNVATSAISLPAGAALDFSSDTLERDVRALLRQIDPEFDFEYLRSSPGTTVTRPTSRTYYEFSASAEGLTATRNVPNFQKALIELHKGHGPQSFKTWQKFMALGLLVMVLSGLAMGLMTPVWRRPTMIAGGLGLAIFIALAGTF